jgi:Flp pilus assembly protein CpaB
MVLVILVVFVVMSIAMMAMVAVRLLLAVLSPQAVSTADKHKRSLPLTSIAVPTADIHSGSYR